MNWDNDIKLEKAQQQGIERTLFPNLNSEEQTVVEALQQTERPQINMLSVRTNLSMATPYGFAFRIGNERNNKNYGWWLLSFIGSLK